MASQDEIEKAFAEGMEHYGKGVGSHTAVGQHLSPYAKDSDPDLLAAWLAGYDRAAKAAGG